MSTRMAQGKLHMNKLNSENIQPATCRIATGAAGARSGQRGATLLVSMIMLVVLTLFAVTGFNLTGVNLKIVGNFQQQKYSESVVKTALEQVLSSITIFQTQPLAALCVNPLTSVTSAPSGTPLACAATTDVLVDKPKCNYTVTAKGYTKKVGELSPEDTNWEVRASYTDPASSATAGIVQGVAVRMLAGNCPAA